MLTFRRILAALTVLQIYYIYNVYIICYYALKYDKSCEEDNGLRSPNTVAANNVNDILDIVTPLKLSAYPEATVHVGTQINGVPHIGTIATHAAAFAVAERIRDRHGIPSKVLFTALDNAPVKSLDRKRNGSTYQICAAHAIHAVNLEAYEDLYESYTQETDVPYDIQTYTEQQSTPEFRAILKETIEHPEQALLAHILDPKDGRMKIRVPGVEGYAQKDCSNSNIRGYQFDGLDVYGEPYSIPLDSASFIDTNTMLRNLVKEVALARDNSDLHVIVKGSDWSLGTPLIDRAASVIGQPTHTMPSRVFSPLILDKAGAKLAKSNMTETEIADMKAVAVRPRFARDVLHLMRRMSDSPRDFLRNYTVDEFMGNVE